MVRYSGKTTPRVSIDLTSVISLATVPILTMDVSVKTVRVRLCSRPVEWIRWFSPFSWISISIVSRQLLQSDLAGHFLLNFGDQSNDRQHYSNCGVCHQYRYWVSLHRNATFIREMTRSSIPVHRERWQSWSMEEITSFLNWISVYSI